MDVNYWAVVVAVVASFVFASVYYSLFAKQYAQLRGMDVADTKAQPLWKILVEIVRTIVLASVIAGLSTELEIDDLAGALGLALAAWVGFPFMILSGAVLWDDEPWKLAALHLGDWLAKLLIIAVTVGVWT